MEAVREGDQAMATKCLELCQALVSQGKPFTFSLTHTSTSFTFSLDTRGEEKVEKKVEQKDISSWRKPLARKKSSPSTLRRNARRKEKFMKRKTQPPARSPGSPARPPAAPGSWRSSPSTNTSLVGVKLTRIPKSDIPQCDGLEEESDTIEADAYEKDSKTVAPEEQKTEDFSRVLKLLKEMEENHEKDRQIDKEENEAILKASFKESFKNNV